MDCVVKHEHQKDVTLCTSTTTAISKAYVETDVVSLDWQFKALFSQSLLSHLGFHINLW